MYVELAMEAREGGTRSQADLVKQEGFLHFTECIFSILLITSFIFQLHSPSQELLSHQFLGILSSLWISSPFFLLSSQDWTMECPCRYMNFRLCSPISSVLPEVLLHIPCKFPLLFSVAANTNFYYSSQPSLSSSVSG